MSYGEAHEPNPHDEVIRRMPTGTHSIADMPATQGYEVLASRRVRRAIEQEVA